MEMSEIEFAEGGLLSEKRVYLRMIRERLVFDVCAAPFGTGYFFSCRTAEIPRLVKLWQIIATLLFLGFTFIAFLYFLGTFRGFFAFVVSSVLAVYFLRNTVALGFSDIDKMLMESPLVGTIYEVFFRKETYHRIDSRLCYLQLVPKVVQKLAEDATAAKGVHILRQYALSPILGDLYRPVDPLPQGPSIVGK